MEDVKRMDTYLDNIYIDKFRKLSNIKIPIGRRITFISGHNAVGKSTILGLIANGSEYKSTDNKSLFEKNFGSKFNEIFRLDLEKDYNKNYSALLKYSFNGNEIFKKCAISKHKKSPSVIANNPKSPEHYLKIVPRNYNLEEEKLDNGTFQGIGASAKVPMPTLYIGMSRIMPNGEIFDNMIRITKSSKSSLYKDYYNKLYSTVFPTIESEINLEEELMEQDVKYSQKRSLVPFFKNHSPESMSLGQDSISTILTAITSFYKLKEEIPEEYKGGILVIDEVDAGLHPYAQLQLFKLLDEKSKELNLQIICTTHSLTLTQELLRRSYATSQNIQDPTLYYSLSYIQNIRNPKIMPNPTYSKVKNDMLLQGNPLIEIKKQVNIYVEDNEAKDLLQTILDHLSSNLTTDDYRYEVIASQINCDTLLKLPEKDDYFKSVVIIPDGDVKTKETYRQIIENNKNILPLPTQNNPEDIIINYLKDHLLDGENENHEFWISNFSLTSQHVEQVILIELIDDLKSLRKDDKIRSAKKKWYNKHKMVFEKSNLLTFWLNDNLSEVNDFVTKLDAIILDLLKSQL